MTEQFEHTHVRLISSEGHVFVVDTRAACVSNTIKNMLSAGTSAAWALVVCTPGA